MDYLRENLSYWNQGTYNDTLIDNMMNWRHSGFNVYCGNFIWPHNEKGLENLARYIIRASFSQEQMTHISANDSSDGVSQVIYQSKDGTSTKKFDDRKVLAKVNRIHIATCSARYECRYCNKTINDTLKEWMLNPDHGAGWFDEEIEEPELSSDPIQDLFDMIRHCFFERSESKKHRINKN